LNHFANLPFSEVRIHQLLFLESRSGHAAFPTVQQTDCPGDRHAFHFLNGPQFDINAMPTTMTTAPTILIGLIFSPKIRWDRITMKKMHPPEKTGYAMLKFISFSAFVKNKTLMPPRTKPSANIMNQKILFSLFEMLLYKR
jgi:hypothetical protein